MRRDQFLIDTITLHLFQSIFKNIIFFTTLLQVFRGKLLCNIFMYLLILNSKKKKRYEMKNVSE